MEIFTWVTEEGEKFAATTMKSGQVVFASPNVPVFGFTTYERSSVPDKCIKYFVAGALYSQMFVWYNLKEKKDLHDLLMLAARLQEV